MSVLDFSVNTAALDGSDTFVVTAAGEVDMYAAPELEQAFEGVVGLGGTSVVLDLAEVSFVDSTVLSVLIRQHERLRDLGGGLVVVTEDRRVLRTFEITGVDRVLTVEQRLAQGIERVVNGSR
jgi:anti-sigma B factor antagonist